ncbi:MAG: PhoH family protein [Phycisphaerales bacterium]
MEVTIKVPSGADRVAVVGAGDRNLKLLREALGVRVLSRDGRVVVAGSAHEVAAARRVIETLTDAAERDEPMSKEQVLDMIAQSSAEVSKVRRGWKADDRSERPGRGASRDRVRDFEDEPILEPYDDDEPWEERLNVYVAGKAVRPRTDNQMTYLRCIREFDLTFGLGPAGTGKTYLAVAAAVHLLRAGRAKRVVLTRPAVEAGEKLGFLPGDFRDKVNPYLRPLLDALNDMMDFSTARRFMENDIVEVVPLAFMRGRTLNNSVIILDEAQNCTKGQMKMFLTRMGQGSKVIVTGDPTQTDLPDGTESGLLDAVSRLAKTEGVAFVGFEPEDVVRHDLVKRIIRAYDDVKDDRDAFGRPNQRRKRAAASEKQGNDEGGGPMENDGVSPASA